MQACNRCHERKVRCDKSHPCRRCQQAGIDCRYSDRSKERLYTQDHVDHLEKRLKRLETRNKLLSRELSRSRSSSTWTEGVVTGASPPPPPRINGRGTDVLNQVSYLTINASGESSYLGSASGILLADFVRANVDTGNPRSFDSVSPSAGESQSKTPNRSMSSRSHPSNQSSGDQYARHSPVHFQLPPYQLAKKLVAAYLNHDHICYPILHPSAVVNILRRAYGDDAEARDSSGDIDVGSNHGIGSGETDPYESFVLNMIFAIATTHVNAFDWQILPSAESHHDRALSSIAAVLQIGGIRSLQATLLLTQYRMGSSIHDNSASMWHLVGIATRLALQLGLHREESYVDEGDSSSIRMNWNTGAVHVAISRNCFWSTVAMDRIVSNVLGRPFGIQLQDIEAELPTSGGDSLLDVGLEVQESITPLDTTSWDERTEKFCHIVRYRLICGKIVATLHGRSGKASEDANVSGQRDELALELRNWERHLDELDFSQEAQQKSCFLSRDWFEMIFHNAMLMLYRPSPRLDVSRDNDSLQTVFSSAKRSITLYSALHRSRKLNHSWLTLQAVFMSGLSYIFAVSMLFREKKRQMAAEIEPQCSADAQLGPLQGGNFTLEFVNDTRACSNILMAVSERWAAQRHCSEVFNRLSDAALADVIKVESEARAYREAASVRHDKADTQPSGSRDLGSSLSMYTPPYTDGAALGEQRVMGMSQRYQEPNAMPENASNGAIMETSSLSQLAVDNEFRLAFEDFQMLYDQDQVDFSVYQLSQAWNSTF